MLLLRGNGSLPLVHLHLHRAWHEKLSSVLAGRVWLGLVAADLLLLLELLLLVVLLVGVGRGGGAGALVLLLLLVVSNTLAC